MYALYKGAKRGEIGNGVSVDGEFLKYFIDKVKEKIYLFRKKAMEF
jgi:hypothetical protein